MSTRLFSLARKLFPSVNRPLRQMHQMELISQFEQDLRPRSFMESYQVFYYLAIGLALLAQMASAYSSYHYVSELIQLKVQEPNWTHSLTLLMLSLIEVVKFYLFKITLQKYFSLNRESQPILMALALGISAISAYASIVGGGKYGIDSQKITQTEQNYSKQIQEKQAQIQTIQNADTYKQIIWLGNGQTTKVLNTTGLALIQKREEEISQLQKQQNQALEQVQVVNQFNERRYQWLFGTFEVIFLTCSIFVWHFKRTTILDQRVQEALQSTQNEGDNSIQQLNSTLNAFAESLNSTLKALQNPNSVENLNSDEQVVKKNDYPKVNLASQAVTLNQVANTLKPKTDTEAVNPHNLQKPTLLKISPFKVAPLQETLNGKVAIAPENEALKQLQNQQVELEATLKRKDEELQNLQSALQQKFEATLKQASLKNAKYLQKYQAVVEVIFDMEYRQFSDAEIREQIMQNFKVSEGTYYNIKRILNNPTN